MKSASNLRKQLSAMDLDPGYFCKFVKDQFVRKFIKENKLKSILDIGCDTCFIDQMLNYDNYSYKYTGVDVRKSFDKSKLNKNSEAVVVKDIFTFLKNNKKKFDVVLLLDVVEHMKNKLSGLNLILEVKKHLKIGGYLLISTPNSINGKINWPKYHKYEYNYSEILDFCKSNNLVLKNFFGWSIDKKIKHSIFPYEMSRVIYAMYNPEVSRDVMMVFRKSE